MGNKVTFILFGVAWVVVCLFGYQAHRQTVRAEQLRQAEAWRVALVLEAIEEETNTPEARAAREKAEHAAAMLRAIHRGN
jgi:anaerobic C4-dicarboxylate transporter